ncbi:MAG: pyridoxal phosphate-dependent aminotransferase [Anaerolineae bacterium]|nr:pyridoxal phosphate-dependent aminotransferase [Anaerolineae bacterium]
MKLSERATRISPSMTFAISSKAKALKAQGVDICDFSVGEPDFITPALMREAAKAALDEGRTKYTPTAGLPELRTLIAEKLNAENGLAYHPEQVLVTVGAKQALFNVLMVVLNPGDEALVPTPAWVTYPEIVKITGAEPVLLPTDETTGFRMTPEQLDAAITDKTRVLILNSPSNPTGAVYTTAEIAALAEVIVRRQILVVADEIYEKLVYDGVEHRSIGSLGKEVLDLTVTCNGFSKAFAATGWRLGYAAGPLPIIKAAAALQSHSTSGATTFAQYGALAALNATASAGAVAEMRRVFESRRDLVVPALRAIPRITCALPQGAFYAFPNISATGLGSMAFCERLLAEEHVAAVPGIAFGADTNIRISYATDTETLREGLKRLRRFAVSLG